MNKYLYLNILNTNLIRNEEFGFIENAKKKT